MNLDLTHPAVSDLRRTARRRLPKFAFEYLDSGTGSEMGVGRNRAGLDAILFMPGILRGSVTVDLRKTFMGHDYSLPIGIAPVGMSGMIWPGAERKLARVAAAHHIPFCLSTVAATTPEAIGPHVGAMGWFQLYPPEKAMIRKSMLKRIKAAGFDTLAVTVDVPFESRRERQRRAHIATPPRITPSILFSMLRHPRWSLGMMAEGRPRMKFVESYLDRTEGGDIFSNAGRLVRGNPDWDYLRDLRQEWEGTLIVKGVLEPDDAVKLVEEGIDAIWVSNHSARQFEAGPACIEQLPRVRAAVGAGVPIIFDSGLSSGLDVMRALALGADFVFMARAFHYALAALGERGIEHLLYILRADIETNMAQIGTVSLDELSTRLIAR